jgi:hypothetical protein
MVESCKVSGAINLLMPMLRPDIPPLYEDIHLRSIMLDNAVGPILLVEP